MQKKRKNSRKCERVLKHDSKEEATNEKLGWQGHRIRWKVSKNYAKLKERQFTLKWVTLGLLLLNVQYDLSKKNCLSSVEDDRYKYVQQLV